MRIAQRAFLLRELVKRDVSARYAGSTLGLLWSLVQPLWTLVLFTFVFSVLLRLTLAGERTQNFAAYLFCGLLPWMAVSEGLTRAATAVTDNGALLKRGRFPSALLVSTVVLSALLHASIAGVLFVAVLLATGQWSPGSPGWLLLALPLQFVLVLGLGLLLAAVQVFARDTVQVLTMVWSAWFYLTPIVYPLALVPERYRPVIENNPLTALVQLYRSSILGEQPPAADRLLVLAAASLIALGLGALVFRRLEPGFADEV